MSACRADSVSTRGVSFVVCCHNSAARLPETLAHLARQKVATGRSWEVIVVDNASTDDTAAVALQCWPEPAPAPLRVVAEPKAGKSHALNAGCYAAAHEIICFVDDDNWLRDDWVERIAGIFGAHPEVGACGGRSEAVPQIPAPPWFEAVEIYYAVGRQGRQPGEKGDITDSWGTLLWGAGLAIRKEVWNDLLQRDFEYLCVGRRGTQLSTGEDAELCYALRALGWRLWYDDDLVLRHFIPEEKLRLDYLDRLIRGIGAASVFGDLYLMALREPPFDKYPGWKQTWFFQVAKVIWARAFFAGAASQGHSSDEKMSRRLAARQLQGRWHTLWNLAGRYGRLRHEIFRRYGHRQSTGARGSKVCLS